MRVDASDKEFHDRLVLLQSQTHRKEDSRIVATDLDG